MFQEQYINGAMSAGEGPAQAEGQKPFRLVEYYSVTSLVIILMFTLLISTVVSQRTEEVVLRKQEQFALLLAENLNHQVMVRFVIPTLEQFGRINVGEPDQFKLLDAVVRNLTHSFKVLKVNILDLEGNIIYSTQPEYISRVEVESVPFQKAASGGQAFYLEPKPSIISLGPERPARMVTFVPLRDERRRTAELGPPRAVFEIDLDVREDFERVWQNQVLVAGTLLLMMTVLFVILRSIVLRGQRVMAAQAEERAQLLSQLSQSQRLASLGRMIAGVAHEIRNPLGIVRSTAELLGTRVDDKSKPLAGVIVEESTRLNRIVTEFLDFARPQKPRLEPIFVEDVLDRIINALRPEMDQQGVEVVRAYQSPQAKISGDADLLYRAFLNIFYNALQVMPQGGRLRVSSISKERGSRSYLAVTIEDSGPGIPEDAAATLFDPFFTTKETGTGLGLSIVSSIIASHGGKVRAGKSDLGGASLEVRLALAG